MEEEDYCIHSFALRFRREVLEQLRRHLYVTSELVVPCEEELELKN